MMLGLMIYFIFVYPMRINGLLCIASKTHTIKANDFDLGEFRTFLFSQTPTHHRQNESCRLEVVLIGHANELTVLFGRSSMIPRKKLFDKNCGISRCE